MAFFFFRICKLQLSKQLTIKPAEDMLNKYLRFSVVNRMLKCLEIMGCSLRKVRRPLKYIATHVYTILGLCNGIICDCQVISICNIDFLQHNVASKTDYVNMNYSVLSG